MTKVELEASLQRMLEENWESIASAVASTLLEFTDSSDLVAEWLTSAILEQACPGDFDVPSYFGAVVGIPWWASAFGIDVFWNDDDYCLEVSDPEKLEVLAPKKYSGRNSISDLLLSLVTTRVDSDWHNLVSRRDKIIDSRNQSDHSGLRIVLSVIKAMGGSIDFWTTDDYEQYDFVDESLILRQGNGTPLTLGEIRDVSEKVLKIDSLVRLSLLTSSEKFISGYLSGSIDFRGSLNHGIAESSSFEIIEGLARDLNLESGLPKIEVNPTAFSDDQYNLSIKGSFHRLS